MADFKKLSDVEIVEAPIDTANVLIEENGVIKKAPKSAVGGIKVAAAEVGQTIVVKAVDENGNPTEWEAVDLPEGASSWNDLKDKPFGEELTREEAIAETMITISNGECEYGEGSWVWKNHNYEAVRNNKIIVIFDDVEYPTTYSKDSDEVTYLTWQLADGTTMQIIDGVKIATSSSLDGEHTFKAVISDSYVETVKPLDEKYIPDIALAKSFIIDRANGTITIGKTTSPQFYYEAAEDYYRLTDDNFYNLAKAAIELGLCTICYKTEDNDDITYELSAGSTVWIPKENGNIRINDFYINKQNS